MKTIETTVTIQMDSKEAQVLASCINRMIENKSYEEIQGLTQEYLVRDILEQFLYRVKRILSPAY